MKKAAGFVTAVLVATPAWAMTQQTKGVVQVAGIMSAAEKWCKEYTIDMGMVRQGLRSSRINMNDPEVNKSSRKLITSSRPVSWLKAKPRCAEPFTPRPANPPNEAWVS